MGAWDSLKATVNAIIVDNVLNLITPAAHRVAEAAVIDQLGEHQFRGVAIPSTSPGVADGKCFWIASTNGTYTNFGGNSVYNELVAFKWSGGSSGSWTKLQMMPITTGSGGSMTAADIRDALQSLTGTGRLSKYAILGGDNGLNYRGNLNFMIDTAQTAMQGDFWVNIPNGGAMMAGTREGDWGISLLDDNSTDEFSPSNPAWLHLPIGFIQYYDAAAIVAALVDLTSTGRLPKDAIWGADFALNYRGSGNLYDSGFKGGMINRKKGDFWIMGTDASPADGDTSAMKLRDWCIALQDAAPTSDYGDTDFWLIPDFVWKGTSIPPRVTTITSSATPTINTDNCDQVNITALAAAITSMTTNLSGTPTAGQRLIFSIKDNSVARGITWGAGFASYGETLPSTTTASKTLTVGFMYFGVFGSGGVWGCLASKVQP